MPESQPTPPLPNEPAARSPTGEILDATTGKAPTSTQTTTSEPTTNEPADPATPATTDTVPERYEFKTADGKELVSPVVDTFSPIFRELGLTQSQADKLVAAYTKHAQSEADVALKAIETTGRQWMEQTKADPELGPNLDKIKIDIGRALETTLTAPEREAFQKSMNDTMAGNNPAFVRAFWKLAQRVGPGTHVAGSGPSTAGQNNKGTPSGRPSIGAALFPNLAQRS